MNAHVQIARNLWGRLAIAGLLIAELAAVPAVAPSLLTAAAAPPAPTLSVTPSGITAGDSYTVSGSHFDPTQKVVVNALPACSNLPAGNPTKPGNADPTCATDGGHPELFGSSIAITPAADGSFSQSFFSSPLLTDATYNILATSQPVAGDKDDRKGRAVASVGVHAANPAVTLSTNIVSNFSYISATMTGFAPGELVCVADFTTFGGCTVVDPVTGIASIPLPPGCVPPFAPSLICLHPIAEQKRPGLLPMTTTVLAIGATSLRTATTALTIVPHHAAVTPNLVKDAAGRPVTLTLTATGMLPSEGLMSKGQGILFPRGVSVEATADPIIPGTAPTGHASHTYTFVCPNPDFPAGTFSLGVFGFASNLTPQTVPDVTIPDAGCTPTVPTPTLTASSTNLLEGDTTTLTASGFSAGDLLTFTVEAPAPLTGGRLQVRNVAVDASGKAAVDVKVDCCEELHSSLLTVVQNQTGSRSAFGSPLHVTRPAPIVSPDSNFIQAGQPLTLTGSGYRKNQPIQLFLGDLVPCKTNDPALNNPDPSPKCGSVASPTGPFRGVTNLGAPGVTTTNTDVNGNFNVTVPTSYLTAVDGMSMAALPFDRAHPGPKDPGVSIQHANGFVAIERFHPQISVGISDDHAITFEGSGFVPRERVLITDGGVGRTNHLTATADANGTIGGRFAVQPTAPTGTYALSATGQKSGLFATTSFSAETQTALFQVATTADAPQMGPPNANCASTLTGNPCTLRAAIQAANFLGAGPHTISLPTAGIYTLSAQGAHEEDASAGDLDVISTNVVITNTSDGAVAIDGNHADRVLDVGPPANPRDPASPPRPAILTLNRVTVQNGAVPNVGGGIRVGGGSTLDMTNVTIAGNSAVINGGGIFSVGTLSLNNVTISGNSAGLLGGGLFSGNLAILNNSVVRANTVSGDLSHGALGGGIFNSKTLRLNGVTVQDNQIPNGTAGGIANAPSGLMTLTNVTLSGNQAAIGGGSLTAGTALVDKLTVSGNHTSMAEAGFANGGAASLSNVLVQGNSSDDINGGLGNGAFMTLTNALIRDNKAVNINGGFANIGVARLENVTISGNSASSVGGVGNLSSLQMTNSTISGNKALGGGLLKPEHQGLGGGLGNGAFAKVTNATISNNSATGSGGGIASDASVVAAEQDRAATIELVLGCFGNPPTGPNCRPFVFPTSPPTALLQNTLVANSPHGGNCFGVITSLGFNLSSDNTCNFVRTGDVNGTNPRLGPLRNNGGPTLGDARDRNTPFRGAVAGDDNVATDDASFGPGRGSPTLTQALRDDSPAIDAIPAANCPPPDTDQRGIERPQGAGCDIGAFEAKPGGDNQGDNHSDN